MSTKEISALLFAIRAHAEQKRKYTGEPYIVHPIEVAEIVRTVHHTEEMIIAALLHDVVEDTPVTIGDVRERFGDKVAELVAMLSDVSKPEDGNRAARKAIDRAHAANASPEAQTIKLADMIHNTGNILDHDKDFGRVYVREMDLLLPLLCNGDAMLFEHARRGIAIGKYLTLTAAERKEQFERGHA